MAWFCQVCVLERVLWGHCKERTSDGKARGRETSLKAVREIQLRDDGILSWGSGSGNGEK